MDLTNEMELLADQQRKTVLLEVTQPCETDLSRSNSLTYLAARIQGYHEETVGALRKSVQRGMAAGDLLIEARKLLQHGQWLPWLREHCAISDRTAQLYMRLARDREAMEAKSATLADLTLNETAAMLMLSSDIRKLLEMVKTMEGLQGEELIEFCIDNDVAMLSGNLFNAPEPTEQEKVEWLIFVLFLAKKQNFSVEGASYHVDWVQSRGTLLKDWMAPNPKIDTWRKPIPQRVLDEWNAFVEANRARTVDDVTAELEAQASLDEQRAAERTARKSRKKRAAA